MVKDSTDNVEVLKNVFSHLIDESLKLNSSNGIGIAVATILLVGALCIFGFVYSIKSYTKYRDAIDLERKQEREEAKIQAEKDRIEAKSEARQQRERDESAARERARADQEDREQARAKLMEHDSEIINKLSEKLTAHIDKLDDRVGIVQSRTEANSQRIILLEKDFEYSEKKITELEAKIELLNKSKGGSEK